MLGCRLERAIGPTAAKRSALAIGITESRGCVSHVGARDAGLHYDTAVRIALHGFGADCPPFSRLSSLGVGVGKIHRSLRAIIATKPGNAFVHVVVERCRENGSTIVCCQRDRGVIPARDYNRAGRRARSGIPVVARTARDRGITCSECGGSGSSARRSAFSCPGGAIRDQRDRTGASP